MSKYHIVGNHMSRLIYASKLHHLMRKQMTNVVSGEKRVRRNKRMGLKKFNSTVKTCLKRPLKNRQNKGLNDKLVLKTDFSVLFEWPLKTGFTVLYPKIQCFIWRQSKLTSCFLFVLIEGLSQATIITPAEEKICAIFLILGGNNACQYQAFLPISSLIWFLNSLPPGKLFMLF